ncbi:MAG TPA: hypothetical protein VIG64_13555, partial [Actinomycetota bacterium]
MALATRYCPQCGRERRDDGGRCPDGHSFADTPVEDDGLTSLRAEVDETFAAAFSEVSAVLDPARDFLSPDAEPMDDPASPVEEPAQAGPPPERADAEPRPDDGEAAPPERPDTGPDPVAIEEQPSPVADIDDESHPDHMRGREWLDRIRTLPRQTAAEIRAFGVRSAAGV